MSQIISLGIGSPATIANFILFGLHPQEVAGTASYMISLGAGSPAAMPEFMLFGLTPPPVVLPPDASEFYIVADYDDQYVVAYEEN